MVQLDALAVRKTWRFLGAIALIESAVILWALHPVVGALAFRATSVPAFGWLSALVVGFATIAYTARALDLGRFLLVLAPFKVLGLAIAVPSAILEEIFFRMSLMNGLAHAHQAIVVQILVSALAFAVVHAVWGIPGGGMSAALRATAAMAVLGVLLSFVYLASARAVLPCVVAHFLINLVLEPWLGYAYAVRSSERAAMTAAATARA